MPYKLDFRNRICKRDQRLQIQAHANERKLKSGCIICRYNRCVVALHFHHLEGQKKEFNISHCNSWGPYLREVKKCIVVCSNCHYEIHDGMHPKYPADYYYHNEKKNQNKPKNQKL